MADNAYDGSSTNIDQSLVTGHNDLIEEEQVLYASRKKVHPKRAQGFYRQAKWIVMAITLGIYYLTPWIRWERGPGLPDQAVLLDMANQRFYFFFIQIWPHEFFYVAGMLVMAGIGLFLVTSTFGRAWCGYTCPQTVWVDLFLVVERFFEGERNARIKLDAAPMSLSKFSKRAAKHVVWLLIAVATGGAWIFYFADAPTLAANFLTGEAAYVAYATVAVLTATTYIFGGLMREQVCVYMCPWPRIQAAMLDEQSLTVTYNDWRGEPRSRHSKKNHAAGIATGDCVDCDACVAVCPMGIDIRDGQQLECISCALCIDACDGVMNKLGLEQGLVSYTTLKNYNDNMAIATGGQVGGLAEIIPEKVRNSLGELSDKIVHFSWSTLLRTRTLIYFSLYGLIGLAMLFSLITRASLDVNVLPDRNPLYVVLSDGSVRNGYELKILNMKGEARQFEISVNGPLEMQLFEGGPSGAHQDKVIVTVEADKLKAVRLFVAVPRESLRGPERELTFNIVEIGGDERKSVVTNFEAPK